MTEKTSLTESYISSEGSSCKVTGESWQELEFKRKAEEEQQPD